jgi:hydroxypyruvate reductase
MDELLRGDAQKIIAHAIREVQPNAAVRRVLAGKTFPGRVVLVAAGKAAWQMAKTAWDCLGNAICDGVVITKDGHSQGPIGHLRCLEASHPVPDQRSFDAAQAALDLVSGLEAEDTVLFLLSGGGSALFEKPLVSGETLQDITQQLLACGADIGEINTIRKRLSAVKGGRFAKSCAPARVCSIILSDVVGDKLDVIASGPACPDPTTCRQAMEIAAKYQLQLPPQAQQLLQTETPKELDNVETHITGSVRYLVAAAADCCRALGYRPVILTDSLCCQAREAGSFLAAIARQYAGGEKLAFLCGGETVVKLTGAGKGGRNQELALSAADGIRELPGVCVFSVGSDGTDGPTDAAGGVVTGSSARLLEQQGISIHQTLENNDSYHALDTIGALVRTGPTGTNVNDLSVVLIGGENR